MTAPNDHILPPQLANKQILLFDGVCNLCNGFVQFVITRDTEEVYSFASLQSDIGQQLLQQYHIADDLSSVILIANNKAYTQSDVPLRVGQTLGGLWSIARLGWIVPKFIRDFVYNFIAKNRYRWFGKEETCMLPQPKWKKRFLS